MLKIFAKLKNKFFKKSIEIPVIKTESEMYSEEPLFITLGSDVKEDFVCSVHYNDLLTELSPRDVYSISDEMIIYPLSENTIYFTFKISEDHWSPPIAIPAKQENTSLIKTLESIRSPQLD